MIKYLLWKIRFCLWKTHYHLSILYNKIKFKILLGENCGSHFVVAGNLFIILGDKKSRISIGHHFHSLNGKNYNPLSRNLTGAFNVEPGGRLIIGDYVGMSSVSIRCRSLVKIGNRVNIGADSMIMDTDAHSLDYRDRDRSNKMRNDKGNSHYAPICIDDDVFIGTRCIITKGVTIGKRSIIGAGSVVTRDIPADSIAVGNPCKVVKKINDSVE